MQIPALDAAESKRVGVMQGDNFDIAAIMHDVSVPERNSGKYFRTSRPICIRTTEPVCLETIFNTAQEHDQHNLSEEFWQEADKMYRAVSPDHTMESSEEFDFRRCISGSDDFEAHFLKNIHHTLSQEGTSHEVWNDILEDARWNRVEDCETGDVDVNLFGDTEQSFEESDFSSQLYIPPMKQVKRWGLYTYNHDGDGFDMYSVWFRFQTGGESISEIPLIDYTGGHASVLSSSPDFGGIEDDHISEEFAESLESAEVTENLSRLEKELVNSIQNMELGERTQHIIDNATEATPVKSSMVADAI